MLKAQGAGVSLMLLVTKVVRACQHKYISKYGNIVHHPGRGLIFSMVVFLSELCVQKKVRQRCLTPLLWHFDLFPFSRVSPSMSGSQDSEVERTMPVSYHHESGELALGVKRL